MINLEPNSIEIARHIAYLCNCYDFEYNNTKIQKLLYACYGVYLVIEDKRLTDEHPHAWSSGVLFPRAFNYMKNCVKDYRKEINLDSNITSILDKTIASFGKFTAGKLAAWSHNEGSPWSCVIDLNNPVWGVEIPDEIIKDYFSKKVIIF